MHYFQRVQFLHFFALPHSNADLEEASGRRVSSGIFASTSKNLNFIADKYLCFCAQVRLEFVRSIDRRQRLGSLRGKRNQICEKVDLSTYVNVPGTRENVSNPQSYLTSIN